MAEVTFQIVEGLEAGRIFQNVSTPLTIGREEDNDIQLNDERISRFHIKVQEDAGRLILTDLDSTNGSRVNGHPVRLRILQPGDLIMVGRCVLLVGGPEEMERLQKRMQAISETSQTTHGDSPLSSPAILDSSELTKAFPLGIPPLPEHLTPLQTAELSDLLEYFRTELLALLCQPTEQLRTNDGDFLRVEAAVWRGLQSLLPELSRLQNRLTNAEDVG